MRTVWKYPLAFSDKAITHSIPHNEVIVHVAMQDDVPTIWAIVDPGEEREQRTFIVTGTGHLVPDDASYIGTVMERFFVWHIWETHPDQFDGSSDAGEAS